MTQPSTSKSRSAPANMDFNEADTHPPSLRCMTPPSWAPEELPLPLAVAGQPAVSKMKQLNTRLLLQYSVAFNCKLPDRRPERTISKPKSPSYFRGLID